jgi:hypothetical protein
LLSSLYFNKKTQTFEQKKLFTARKIDKSLDLSAYSLIPDRQKSLKLKQAIDPLCSFNTSSPLPKTSIHRLIDESSADECFVFILL